MKHKMGHNSDQSILALWTKLEETKELIFKSIYKTDRMQKPTGKCFDLREESADLSINAINKIDEVLSEVKDAD